MEPQPHQVQQSVRSSRRPRRPQLVTIRQTGPSRRNCRHPIVPMDRAHSDLRLTTGRPTGQFVKHRYRRKTHPEESDWDRRIRRHLPLTSRRSTEWFWQSYRLLRYQLFGQFSKNRPGLPESRHGILPKHRQTEWWLHNCHHQNHHLPDAVWPTRRQD